MEKPPCIEGGHACGTGQGCTHSNSLSGRTEAFPVLWSYLQRGSGKQENDGSHTRNLVFIQPTIFPFGFAQPHVLCDFIKLVPGKGGRHEDTLVLKFRTQEKK